MTYTVRPVNINELIEDIRSGMRHKEILNKWGMSNRRYKKLCRKYNIDMMEIRAEYVYEVIARRSGCSMQELIDVTGYSEVVMNKVLKYLLEKKKIKRTVGKYYRINEGIATPKNDMGGGVMGLRLLPHIPTSYSSIRYLPQYPMSIGQSCYAQHNNRRDSMLNKRIVHGNVEIIDLGGMWKVVFRSREKVVEIDDLVKDFEGKKLRILMEVEQ